MRGDSIPWYLDPPLPVQGKVKVLIPNKTAVFGYKLMSIRFLVVFSYRFEIMQGNTKEEPETQSAILDYTGLMSVFQNRRERWVKVRVSKIFSCLTPRKMQTARKQEKSEYLFRWEEVILCLTKTMWQLACTCVYIHDKECFNVGKGEVRS